MTSSVPERAEPTEAVPTVIPRPAIGLRERKKARTRAAIRAEAIRLFAAQGFAATTVEQVAEAADVSPSTFFRYFPTKEAVIVGDEYDPVIFEMFRDQPAELHPVRAFRNAVRTVMLQMTPDALEQERLRHSLLQSVPELRSAMFEEFGTSLGLMAEMLGERIGRPAGDLRVRTLAGAMIGVAISVTLDTWSRPVEWDPDEIVSRFDAAFELLEQGLPL
jgi:AcrR family transcriptional regulator